MIRATFSEPQLPVTIFHVTDLLIQYQICVHEEIIEPTEEDPNTSYVYDFNEFIESTDILKEADVIADPEAYLDYVPVPMDERTEEGKANLRAEINAIRERQDIADMALQELILSQLGE